jgi:hypothetical protein
MKFRISIHPGSQGRLMKRIYLVGVAVVIAACSTHPVRCGGALRPINKAVVSAKPGSSASDSGTPAATGQPNAQIRGDATTKPAATSGKTEVVPAEPRS